VISRVRPKSWTRRKIFLDATIDSGREVKFDVKAFVGRGVLGGVLVQHNHHLEKFIVLIRDADIGF
jgi:hypothetical protein